MMSRPTAVLLAALVALAAPAQAHGPTPQKVEETLDIAAPPAKVWAALADFANIAGWNAALAKSSGDAGCANGTVRVITLKAGGELTESVDECNKDEMALYYRLAKENVDAFPVSSYSSTIKVAPGAAGGSTVTWVSRLYRADTTNEPPEDKNDASAVKAVTDFVKTGLSGLKSKLEAK